jgi:CDGSH-type Zn-finger protein
MMTEGDYVHHRNEIISSEKPKIARACPSRMYLKKGETYLYCTCGYSKYQPFCDGEHKNLNNGFKPLIVTIEKEQKSFLWCPCKRNDINAGPLCDGNHTRIDDW